MEYLVIAIIIVTAIFIVLYRTRKKHRAEIDRLEQLKLTIQQKPVLEELTKVKQLNMNGQTEELFERWRRMWTEVMDIAVPAIDSQLEAAEDAADRFKFKKAAILEAEAEKEIEQCDVQMNRILTELDDLLGSEQKNRSEIDILKEQYRLSRKNLLAHQHAFGSAARPLEKRLESFVPLFEEYDYLTANGNYLEAREVVNHLSREGAQVFELIREIPELLSEIQSKIPASIQELRSGQREMEMKSYFLAHLQMEPELNDMEEELMELKQTIGDLDSTLVKNRISDMKNRIETFYELLEKEVMAKQYVDKNFESLGDLLDTVATHTRETSDECALVQQSYKISEDEAELPKIWVSHVRRLQERYELMLIRAEEEQAAYSSMEEELKSIREEVEKIDKSQAEFAASLKSLRVDETAARNKLEVLKRSLIATDRLLHKANMPGIPEEMDARLEEAEEQLFVAVQSLREEPLNMKTVEANLATAEGVILETEKKAAEMVENVQLIERIIQYGNRYRHTDATMNKKLLEAEDSFRQLRYKKALEEAATAVEEHEPGAMKRIEVLSKEDAWRL